MYVQILNDQHTLLDIASIPNLIKRCLISRYFLKNHKMLVGETQHTNENKDSNFAFHLLESVRRRAHPTRIERLCEFISLL